MSSSLFSLPTVGGGYGSRRCRFIRSRWRRRRCYRRMWRRRSWYDDDSDHGYGGGWRRGGGWDD
ncbi:MAG: hypothetical protein ACT4QG_14645 [Sporichthyaceae bacterium]